MRAPLELSVTLACAAIGAGIYLWHPWGRRGTCCAGAGDAAFIGDEAFLSSSLQFYRDEHGRLPDSGRVIEQLTQFSDANGNTSPVKDADHPFGPYVRAIPRMPLGENKGLATLGIVQARGIAWIYDEKAGMIRGNCDRSLLHSPFQ